ncbi:MAG TPA: alpha/beta hydrolase family protein [Caldilineaceae bacterium]|nr:alpha/beta hydrolase family protein [Caldilineaceae bacterium]
MTQFFSTEAALRQRFQTIGRRLSLQADSQETWQLWRQALRSRIRELQGVDRLVPTAPNPRITETVACDGYRRERVEIDTEPGVTMPVYVLIPDDLPGTAPGVLAPHGHSSGGKYAVAGIRGLDPGVDQTIDQHNYDYGVQAVRRGYVVFCPDARGFGERRESFTQGSGQLLNSSCHQLAHMALPLGLTVAGMWTWDLMRLLDYAQTRPEVQGQKLGSIGLSGGGLQTLWLAALDERIACAVISGYFYGVADSLLHLSNNCDCNFIPHMWEEADMGDVGALIAPRPLLIEAARQDGLNGPRGIVNVEEQVAITQRAYDLLDVSDQLATDYFDGGHVWHGTMAFDWLDRWLRG